MKRFLSLALSTILLAGAMPVLAGAALPTIKELNTESANGSHANDYYQTASIEKSYRETVSLTDADHGRYNKAYYPRIKKVKDDLYILFWHYSSTGAHIYYATSADGVNWDEPQILYRNNTDASVFTYTEGEHAGEEDRYIAVNPDAVVLDNGDILCTYYIRPNKGYLFASDYNGLYLVRGTVGADNTITWGEHKKVYTGQGWEPFIWQRPDGRVEIYWTSIVAYVSMYGFDRDKRSTCTAMIWSDDNGETWTPKVEAGDTNHYQAYRVYNEYIGDKIPYGTNADGTPMYTEAVPYFGGQMPAATRLYDGRTLLALEVQKLDNDYDFSYAISDKDGNWKNLGLLENGPENAKQSIFKAAGPYLATFPSGEVYLTYHWTKQHYRMGAPDGSEFSPKVYAAAYEIEAGATGGNLWGSSALVSSHEVITATQLKFGDTGNFGIQLVHSYLNHRTDAKAMTPTVDAVADDWTANTDAYFIGSESQAQMTVQTAHDADNLYFLISRLDKYLTEKDTVSVNVGVGLAEFYTVTVDAKGNCTLTHFANGVTTAVSGAKAATQVVGTVGNNEDNDEGYLVEISVPKSALGLTGAASFYIRPELVNADGNGMFRDTLTGVSSVSTALWPEVKLH